MTTKQEVAQEFEIRWGVDMVDLGDGFDTGFALTMKGQSKALAFASIVIHDHGCIGRQGGIYQTPANQLRAAMQCAVMGSLPYILIVQWEGLVGFYKWLPPYAAFRAPRLETIPGDIAILYFENFEFF